MKIMFMGTPEFACVSLKELVNRGYDVASVVTTEDKPRGRGHKMTPPDVYRAAEELGIKNIYQPLNLKKENFEQILLTEKPDLIAVVAYGKLLPEYVIDFPRYGCINVHGSLLPKYRGAAPMQWCLIDGEEETGITTMYMDAGMDSGDMILQEKTEIDENETTGELWDRLSGIGAKLLVETLKQIVELYGISIEEVAYIGDDLNDFEAMKKCGITGCPADAVDEIKNISDYTSKFNGGDGAIRDFVDWILKNKV